MKRKRSPRDGRGRFTVSGVRMRSAATPLLTAPERSSLSPPQLGLWSKMSHFSRAFPSTAYDMVLTAGHDNGR